MRAPRRRLVPVLVAAILSAEAAVAVGCLVEIAPLEQADGGSGNDAAGDTRDATPLSDAGADTTIAPFDCDSIDATFCDDFNRDAAIAFGSPWQKEQTRTGCTIVVDGTLVTTFDASTGQQVCYLQSNPAPNSGQITLDFDMSFVAASSPPVVVVGLVFAMPTGAPAETFFLYIDGNGTAALNVQETYTDAAFPIYPLASASPFLQPSSACHVTLNVDAVTPTASATATCGAVVISTTPQSPPKAPPGFSAAPSIELGFRNADVTAPAWSITYDNMVFRASP